MRKPASHAYPAALAAAFLLFGAGMADTVLGDDQYSRLIVPSNSLVRLASYDIGSLTATFDGSFVLSGTYVISFEPHPTPDRPDWGSGGFTFTVDPEIAKALPKWDGYPEGAQTIDFVNYTDFKRAVLSKADLDRLLRGGSFTGRVAVRVDHFWTGKPCGYPQFSVRFLEVVTPSPAVASAKTLEPQFC